MSKVEEVARATREAVRNAPERTISFEEMSRIVARAAIEAMLKPTAAMVNAGEQSIVSGGQVNSPSDVYNAMIDAALSEEGR